MINISNKRECFFDNYLIDEKKTTAETRVHHPVKREPVMIYDAPWEGNNSHFQTMLFDGEKYIINYQEGTEHLLPYSSQPFAMLLLDHIFLGSILSVKTCRYSFPCIQTEITLLNFSTS